MIEAKIYYILRLPIDRAAQLFTFSWCILWNGEMYSTYREVNVSKRETIKEQLEKIKLELNQDISQVGSKLLKGEIGYKLGKSVLADIGLLNRDHPLHRDCNSIDECIEEFWKVLDGHSK